METTALLLDSQFFVHVKYCCDDQIRKSEMGIQCNTHGSENKLVTKFQSYGLEKTDRKNDLYERIILKYILHMIGCCGIDSCSSD
jgi:hypothetical protein